MSELQIIARHAATVLVGQLAVMAFGVTDTIVAGRYADTSLAALSVGTAVYISVFVTLMGMLQALLPVWAKLHGAKQHLQLGRSFRQSLYLCTATMILGMGALLYPGAILRLTEVPLALQGEVERYLAVLALALPPSLLFRMYSTLNQGLGRPQLVTWLQIAALFIKVPLSIWFAFGGYGLEPRGVVGCAWATLCVNYAMLGVALWLLRTQELYRPYAIWRALERPNWKEIAAFARLGIPGGLAIMVEVTSFTLMALFIARLGTVASAGHQIAANITTVLYMMPLSISIAASSRVSYWMGSGNTQQVRVAIRKGFQMMAVAALTMSATLFMLRINIAALYANSPDVIAMTVPLLGWVALYHLADAVQVTCVFLLRSFGVTMAPLLVYCLLLWGMGVAGGYLLTYAGLLAWPAMHTPTAFWATSTAALGLTAFIFIGLLSRANRLER